MIGKIWNWSKADVDDSPLAGTNPVKSITRGFMILAPFGFVALFSPLAAAMLFVAVFVCFSVGTLSSLSD